MSTPFIPKQAIPFDGALLQELQGNVSDTIALDLLHELPDLNSSSIVHDNGCGYGAVTMAVMNLNTGAQVIATDINAMFMAQLQANIAAHPEWPIKVETMDACNLTFQDNIFDLSLTTFVFTGLEDDVGAAGHILRTLKKGVLALLRYGRRCPGT